MAKAEKCLAVAVSVDVHVDVDIDVVDVVDFNNILIKKTSDALLKSAKCPNCLLFTAACLPANRLEEWVRLIVFLLCERCILNQMQFVVKLM